MKIKYLLMAVLTISFFMFIGGSKLYAQDEIVIEFFNPEYMKPPDESQNVEITDEASIEDILNKIEYYYSVRDHDKAIKLCNHALSKTNDKFIIARINFSLSSNYIEKGIINKDNRYYELAIQSAKKSLDVFPDNWQVLGNIGTAYMNMGNYEQAVYYFSQAKKYLDPNNPNYPVLEQMLIVSEEMSKK